MRPREQAPQQVGDAEGDEKSVRGEAGAEQARDHRVAREAENAGHQRHAAHRGERAQKIHGPDYTKTKFQWRLMRKARCAGTKMRLRNRD